jgi:hypothetical protein
MSKKAAEHHKKAHEHLTHAARHHSEAANGSRCTGRGRKDWDARCGLGHVDKIH